MDREDEHGIEAAHIVVMGTRYGASTSSEGLFRIRLPVGQWNLSVLRVGYARTTSEIEIERGECKQLLFTLQAGVSLGDIEVEWQTELGRSQSNRLDTREIESFPAAISDGLTALHALPGVASSNELSSQFSFRGGGYNENAIYLDDLRVATPVVEERGERSGLSAANPFMIQAVELFDGSPPRRFATALSSIVVVKGRDLEDSSAVQLKITSQGQDLGFAYGAKSWGVAVGARRHDPKLLLSSLETKGSYDTAFQDLQVLVRSPIIANHKISAWAYAVDQHFSLSPTLRETAVYGDRQSSRFALAGNEKYGHRAGFLGLNIERSAIGGLRVGHSLSAQFLTEVEDVFLKSVGVHGSIEPPTDEGSGGFQPSFAGGRILFSDNSLRQTIVTARGRYEAWRNKNYFDFGWDVERHIFSDHIAEYDRRTEVVRGYDLLDYLSLVDEFLAAHTPTLLVDERAVDATLARLILSAYLDHTTSTLEDRLVISSGVRAEYSKQSRELLISPAIRVDYALGNRFHLKSSIGIQHQIPSFREWRSGQLQTSFDELRSQRALNVSVGINRLHNLSQDRLSVEAFFRYVPNAVSYQMRNLALFYSGSNDSKARAWGLEAAYERELLPGLKSWFSYSFLSAQERLLEGGSWGPRPASQGHTLTMFLQDYVPGDRTMRGNLRLRFNSGFRFTPISIVVTEDSELAFQNGRPNARTFPWNLRADLGMTKTFHVRRNGRDLFDLMLHVTLLNLYDWTATVDHEWVPDLVGQRVIPTRTTTRTVRGGFTIRM